MKKQEKNKLQIRGKLALIILKKELPSSKNAG